jgi:hypothetical protein
MITLNILDDVEYGLLEQTEAEAMAGVIAEAFNRYEPMAVALSLSASELEK